MHKHAGHFFLILALVALTLFSSLAAADSEILTAAELLKIKTCRDAVLSPDQQWIAYTIQIGREAADKPGNSYTELHLYSVKERKSLPFITGKVNLTNVRWTLDGHDVSFLMKRGEDKFTQVWKIPVNGGEARRVTRLKTDIESFEWLNDGEKKEKLLYIATDNPSPSETTLSEKGYGFIYFEENLKHKNLFLLEPGRQINAENPKQLTRDITVWNFVVSPDGRRVAAAISPLPLTDHSYMFQKLHLLDLTTGKLEKLVDNPGKLGNFCFSPDGTKLAYNGALDLKDHAPSQLFSVDIASREQKNLTPKDFRGHVQKVFWTDPRHIAYISGEGVWPRLSVTPCDGGERKIIYDSSVTGIVFFDIHFISDLSHFVFSGQSTSVPGDLYMFSTNRRLERLTNLNPWLGMKKLGAQMPERYTARDGQEIEGLLILPTDYQAGQRYPLIVIVHGGPEGHYSNGWLSRYSEPAQVLAGKGYVVFLPNYRASTGYGYAFAIQGYKDPAGKEFDDIADGIQHLIAKGLADPERVGLGGGSYGGYAAAWFSSYYTELVRAVVMFVGISNVISKHGTTDIPYEELYVHSGDSLEKVWQFQLERSPVFHAHKCRSAVLIAGGADDPRVHPTQSMEYFRRLKMNGHKAVRLVQYPGEKHGNRKQPACIDLLYRTLQWYDWYVKDKKPLTGDLPPLDISENYGLNPE